MRTRLEKRAYFGTLSASVNKICYTSRQIETFQRTCPPPGSGQGEEPAVKNFLRGNDEGGGRRGGDGEANGVPRKGPIPENTG
jgi:hypothetical protein